MARDSDSPASERAATFAAVVTWTYSFAILNGVLRADDMMVSAVEDALQMAEEAGNDPAVSLAQFGLAIALLSREAEADRERGLELMSRCRSTWLREQWALQDVPVTDIWAARERAMHGDRNDAVVAMRTAVEELLEERRLGYGIWAVGILVETLLQRGTGGDLAEAEAAIERLVNLRADQTGVATREIMLLRLGALVARARGDDGVYRDSVRRYRDMAESLGFEGHIAWAESMIEGE
jgi:hypothetical protein